MSHTPSSIAPKRSSVFAMFFSWLAAALILLLVFSSVGLMTFREQAFWAGAQNMSRVIENSLAQKNLEGVGPLVSVGVRDCVIEAKRENQAFVEGSPGLFALGEIEDRGAQAYRACYIEQLESARFLSNPASLEQALEAVSQQIRG